MSPVSGVSRASRPPTSPARSSSPVLPVRSRTPGNRLAGKCLATARADAASAAVPKSVMREYPWEAARTATIRANCSGGGERLALRPETATPSPAPFGVAAGLTARGEIRIRAKPAQ